MQTFLMFLSAKSNAVRPTHTHSFTEKPKGKQHGQTK
jgi:hypothetical protein